MNGNNLQPNTNYNTSFTPNTAPVASQQQQAQPQGGAVPPLGNASDLSNNPAAKNLQNYSAVAGELDPFSSPEYQPIKPGEPYMEKLPDEAANTKKLNICLKNARENEELGDFKDAEKAYKKALKYTESAEHYKAYGECLRAIYLALSQVPSTPEKDETKERLYREKTARAFYYLGDLYKKQGALQDAQAAYRASGELALHELPLKALLDVARQIGEKGDIVDALGKLADFYAGKGDTALAIKMLEEAVQVETSSIILEKLAALHGQVGGEDSQLKVNEARIQQFELQISQDPKNIGLYRKYVWFLKDIGKRNEARAVKERMDGLLQTMQQKILKQKTKILDLKAQLDIHLEFSNPADIQDAYLIPLLKQKPYIKLLNLQGCTNITNAGLVPLEGLKWLTSLNLYNCDKITDAGLRHLAGLTQLTSLNLERCNQLTDAGLRHLAGLSQLKELNLYNCKQITDAGLQQLAGLKQLTELNLQSCTQLTGAGLRHLAGLKQLTELNLQSCTQLTDAGLQHLAGLSQLRSLNLSYCDKLTGAGLQHLAGLSQLTSLNLYNCKQLSDAGLQHLAGLTQLTSLNLSSCNKLTAVGLQHLAGLTQLTSLNLYNCKQLSDAGLQHLAGLSQLRSLYLSYCDKLTDAGLQHLAGLSQLTSLYLSYCDKLTDAGLQHLAGLSQLTSLYLSSTQLTGAGLQHLAGLSQLTSLNLSSCNKLTDAGLQHLAGLSQLTSLYLSSCNKITSNAKKELKKQIPGLRI